MRRSSGLDQSASVKTLPVRSTPYSTAASEDVRTTRDTPASSAARSTRRVPSRAGTIRSFGSSGGAAGIGLATWWTYVHPATASAQPSSLVRSAAAMVRRSAEPGSARWGARSACNWSSEEARRAVPRTW